MKVKTQNVKKMDFLLQKTFQRFFVWTQSSRGFLHRCRQMQRYTPITQILRGRILKHVDLMLVGGERP